MLSRFLFFVFLPGILASVSRVPKGNELQIPVPAGTISLDPTAVQDQSSLWVSRQVNCQLVRLNQGSVLNEAVESYRYLSPSKIQMKLGKEYRFHDGSELRADDIIATFDYLRTSRGVLRNIFGWINQITKA